MKDDVILFLDFDGVLHAVRQTHIDRGGESHPFCWLPILSELLEPYPEVKIIVSSDWRCSTSDEELKQLLGPLAGRFLGVVQEYDALSRAEEIFAEVRRRNLTRWLAVDDHPSVVSARSEEPRFVACEAAFGISSTAVQEELRAKLEQHAAGAFQLPDR